MMVMMMVERRSYKVLLDVCRDVASTNGFGHVVTLAFDHRIPSEITQAQQHHAQYQIHTDQKEE